MKNIITDNDASAWAWLVVLVGIFTLVLMWAIFSPILDTITVAMNSTITLTPEFKNPMRDLFSAWFWYPVMTAFGLILWAIAYSVKQEGGGYYR